MIELSLVFIQFDIYCMKKINKIVIDSFCKKQFSNGTAPGIKYGIQQFEKKANQYYHKTQLIDGYAPFCKHIFVQNFANIPISVTQITPQNEHLLKTSYQARTQQQLPVLQRFFTTQSIELRPAKYLDLILYSKQQIQEENQQMGNKDVNADVDYDFGIVWIKPTDVPYETPMDPITMMRNALGKEHGGSGVPLDRQKYLQSVKYWSIHAQIR